MSLVLPLIMVYLAEDRRELLTLCEQGHSCHAGKAAPKRSAIRPRLKRDRFGRQGAIAAKAPGLARRRGRHRRAQYAGGPATDSMITNSRPHEALRGQNFIDLRSFLLQMKGAWRPSPRICSNSAHILGLHRGDPRLPDDRRVLSAPDAAVRSHVARSRSDPRPSSRRAGRGRPAAGAPARTPAGARASAGSQQERREPPCRAEPIWTGGYVALLTANLLLCFGFYMLPSTLPAYVKQLGGSNLEASLVIGLFSVMSLCSRIISGTIVDALTSTGSSCRASS